MGQRGNDCEPHAKSRVERASAGLEEGYGSGGCQVPGQESIVGVRSMAEMERLEFRYEFCTSLIRLHSRLRSITTDVHANNRVSIDDRDN